MTCLSMKRPSDSVAENETKRLAAIYDRISVQSVMASGRNIGMCKKGCPDFRTALLLGGISRREA